MNDKGGLSNDTSKSPASQNIMTFKVVLIGDKSVGKTSIVKRYTDNIFQDSMESTIGAQFCSKILSIQPK
jgi:GTPase SAR1 family protein